MINPGYQIGNIVTINNPEYHPAMKGVALIITGIVERFVSGENNTYSISLKNNDGDTFSQFIKFIEPIELTEEWLKKCGFKKNGNYYWISLANLKAELHVEIFGEYLVFIIKSDFCDLILDPIKPVHQLQNLYFALTNKELTIKK